VVKEGGIKFLGGERQRIAITRAFLKILKILLFNEAIFAINNIIEKLIYKSLKSRGKGQTTLIVVYCFSIVKIINKIIFLEKGEIKERGNHTELLN